MIRWLFVCLLAVSFLQAAEFPLLQRLEKAKTGDYIVLEANQTTTLLAIRALSPRSIVLEEISAPSNVLKKKPASWAEWIKNKAPGHTSWSMVEIDLKDRQILECYSFSRSAWLTQSPQESLIATLLHLPLVPIKADKRRKIGSPPLDGEPDRRQIWNPPLIYNGQKLDNAIFDVYEAEWPRDGSELGGKTVCLYFDRDKHSPLPYWIQVETTHVTASMRAIDSGKNLPSRFRSLPRRVPEFVGAPVKTKSGLRLSLKSPKYYKEFELFAVDVTNREKQIYPIPHSLISGEGELITINVEASELHEMLQSGHKYTWLVVPVGYTESYTETPKPFLWTSP
ncbi:MAG: hypothetical protein KGJ02_00735 [Verrucomicrobiota bacterium]|nr:hypothetical protein [Verrucomicrobiota bacterium]